MQFHVVIPARYASTRLHAKPLLDIAGKPMVVRVAEQAQASGASTVIVATDHPEIQKAVRAYGYESMLTRDDHASGTDRIAEVAYKKGWSSHDVIVNVQGDEPLIEPQLITEVASNLAVHPQASMSSACHPIHDKSTMLNPNVVKVVMDSQGYALYFSRAPIPYPRDAFLQEQELPSDVSVYRHIGIYGYRAGFLETFNQLSPANIEQAESLEQLRVLWHGHKISLAITQHAPATGVDTEQDLLLVRALFLQKPSKYTRGQGNPPSK